MKPLLSTMAGAFAALLFLAVYLHAQESGAASKRAYLVCEGRCLKGLTFSQHSQLVAPLENGKPDYSKALIRGVVVDVDHSLERIELR